MLLLINRRYPALGTVLGIIAAVTFIAIGMATARSTFVVMGALSLALSIGRAAHRQRSSTPEPR
jgi:uncharacterized membrane protein